MSSTSVTEVRKPEGHIWVACGICNKRTRHEILADVRYDDQNEEEDIQIWENHMVIKCGGCQHLSLCIQEGCSEHFDEDRKPIITTRVYPKQIEGRAEMNHARSLPAIIYRVYREARAAIANDQPIMAGIGIRLIVEMVCKEKAVKGPNLGAQITTLEKNNILTKEGAWILHSLRFLGNQAAHEAKASSMTELFMALDIVEHLLNTVFIIPERNKELRKSTSRKSSK